MRWLALSLLAVSLTTMAQGWTYRDFNDAGQCAGAYLHNNYDSMKRVEAEAKREAMFKSKDEVWDIAEHFHNGYQMQQDHLFQWGMEMGTTVEEREAALVQEAATQIRVRGCRGYLLP